MTRSIWRTSLLAGGIGLLAATFISTAYLYGSFAAGRSIRTPRPFLGWLYEGVLNGALVGLAIGVCVAVGMYLRRVGREASEARASASRQVELRASPPALFPRHSPAVAAALAIVVLLVASAAATLGVIADDELGAEDGAYFLVVIGAIYAAYVTAYLSAWIAAAAAVLLGVRWVVVTRRWTHTAQLQASGSHADAHRPGVAEHGS